VLVNTDVKQSISFVWNGVKVTDVLTGKALGPRIELAPGDGKILKLPLE